MSAADDLSGKHSQKPFDPDGGETLWHPTLFTVVKVDGNVLYIDRFKDGVDAWRRMEQYQLHYPKTYILPPKS